MLNDFGQVILLVNSQPLAIVNELPTSLCYGVADRCASVWWTWSSHSPHFSPSSSLRTFVPWCLNGSHMTQTLKRYTQDHRGLKYFDSIGQKLRCVWSGVWTEVIYVNCTEYILVDRSYNWKTGNFRANESKCLKLFLYLCIHIQCLFIHIEASNLS